MTPLAASTFLQVLFATMLIVPVIILWLAAVFDVFKHGHSGLKIAALLVLILIVPVLGPILYFVFRPPPEGSPAALHMAQADQRREAAARTVGPRV